MWWVFLHFRDELNVLEKEKNELDLDLSNSSDRKHTAQDERQIGQLQGLHQKISDIESQSKEEEEKRKELDAEVRVIVATNSGEAPYFFNFWETIYSHARNTFLSNIFCYSWQILEMKEKIRQQKRKSAGTNNTANKHQTTNRKKLVLEGRLDKVSNSNALPKQTIVLIGIQCKTWRLQKTIFTYWFTFSYLRFIWSE